MPHHGGVHASALQLRRSGSVRHSAAPYDGTGPPPPSLAMAGVSSLQHATNAAAACTAPHVQHMHASIVPRVRTRARICLAALHAYVCARQCAGERDAWRPADAADAEWSAVPPRDAGHGHRSIPLTLSPVPLTRRPVSDAPLAMDVLRAAAPCCSGWGALSGCELGLSGTHLAAPKPQVNLSKAGGEPSLPRLEGETLRQPRVL